MPTSRSPSSRGLSAGLSSSVPRTVLRGGSRQRPPPSPTDEGTHCSRASNSLAKALATANCSKTCKAEPQNCDRCRLGNGGRVYFNGKFNVGRRKPDFVKVADSDDFIRQHVGRETDTRRILECSRNFFNPAAERYNVEQEFCFHGQ